MLIAGFNRLLGMILAESNEDAIVNTNRIKAVLFIIFPLIIVQIL